ncbi:MAG: hypothetical protein IT183_13820 [Acidobacteria bacterium]|nr:hypothetical protein [Acidobacteriota bacterium]
MTHPGLLRLLLLACLVTSTACGTVVFVHTIEVRVSDPSGRLGSAPVEVSVFDNQMGQSAEWARRTMGTAGPDTPHVGQVSSTTARMIFDNSLPERVTISLAVPAYEPGGYFVLQLAPPVSEERVVAAPFVPYGASFAEGGSGVMPLPLRVLSEKDETGWRVRVTIEVPASSSE